MPSIATILSYMPTILFWLLVVVLVISEIIGKFANEIRWMFRPYAVVIILMLASWYAAEVASHVAMIPPDFEPWEHFIPTPVAAPEPATPQPEQPK
jgi:hypothetical protein